MRVREHPLSATAALLGLLALAFLEAFVKLPLAPSASPGTPLPGGALVAWSPAYEIRFFGIEKLHPFDITKYSRIARHLIDEGVISPDQFAIPDEAERQDLARVHSAEYLDSLADVAGLRKALEVPIPPIFPVAMIDRRVLAPMRRSVQGTRIAMAHAIETGGVGFNLGGGYHHALPEMGHGFCLYNDVALAIADARGTGFEGRILVLDTDAHQGDGNHAFYLEDDSVTTVSLQQFGIFPPRVAGTEDHELSGGTTDSEYLDLLDKILERHVARHDLIVHVAGSDVLHDDPLAELELTIEGLVERDLRVLRAARAADKPLVMVLAGGYGPSAATAQARSVAAQLRSLRQAAPN